MCRATEDAADDDAVGETVARVLLGGRGSNDGAARADGLSTPVVVPTRIISAAVRGGEDGFEKACQRGAAPRCDDEDVVVVVLVVAVCESSFCEEGVPDVLEDSVVIIGVLAVDALGIRPALGGRGGIAEMAASPFTRPRPARSALGETTCLDAIPIAVCSVVKPFADGAASAPPPPPPPTPPIPPFV